MFRRLPRQLLKVFAWSAFLPLASWADQPLLNSAHSSVRAVAAVQREVSNDWMRQSEVLGTAVGINTSGVAALAVYVDRESPRAAQVVRSLPEQVRGIPVEIRLTDKFRALRRRRHNRSGGSTTGVSHKVAQTFPIQLGTSGGSSIDHAGFSCCGGTLGALVRIGTDQYILSNWHVFESDTAPGKNNVVSTNGDAILQPGLIDTNCDPGSGSEVATLEKRGALPDNNVDCAIAKVVPGMVRSDGAILEIGTLSAQTLVPAINQAVKKSARTTGLTRSVITGLNGTIKVDYEDGCGGHFAFTKTFTGQIIVKGGSTFLGDGDSGSLLVEDAATNPRAIGLLYAGGSSDSVANPIDEVLAFLGATMVGN